MKFLSWSSLAAPVLALSSLASAGLIIRESPQGSAAVKFGEHSLIINGTRVILYAGEYHPHRQAVPGLWLDNFQKIRSMGYTAVSSYFDWAMLEGQPGHFLSEGSLSVQDFLDAAKQAGIYIIARPGPYINGETAGGGIPGWVQRVPGIPRTRFPLKSNNYLNASMNYWDNICKILADNQVDNGGPVALVQIENEAAGFLVPFSYNDITPPAAQGQFAYKKGKGSVEVYCQDSYPLGFSCGDPSHWPPPGQGLGFPDNYARLHHQQSPLSPMAILEYQGGAIDGWGGCGYDACAILVNGQAERLLYLTAVEFVTTVQNIYMTYGGTNWGNSGQPWGYTSYDYGAAVAENRTITREKYNAAKLVATEITSNYEYLSAVAVSNVDQVYDYSLSHKLATAQAHNKQTGMRLFIVRNQDYTAYQSVGYTLTIPTSLGNVTIPQTIPQIFLINRDAQMHAVDYNIGNNVSIWYSSPDIFAFNSQNDPTILVVYGGTGQPQEMAFSTTNLATPQTVVGSGITFKTIRNRQIMSWTDSSELRVVNLGKVVVYILDREGAKDYWRLQVSSPSDPPFNDPSKPSVILSGGQLMRTASISGTTLSLDGDLNATSPIQIVAGFPSSMSTLMFNGKSVPFTKSSYGSIQATLKYNPIKVNLANLENLPWKYIDGIPELALNYDDSAWPSADIKKSPNDEFDQQTPTSQSGSDYGFNTGSLLFRGHFNATGNEQSFSFGSAGGLAFSNQVWINGQYIGYFPGESANQGISTYSDYSIPNALTPGPNVITVLIDHMGMDEQPAVGNIQFKRIRGINNHTLDGHNASDVRWKLTGNFKGEEYPDKSRGPLNEGGTYAIRHGYHLPRAPVSKWASGKPTDGISQAGVRFYYSSFKLNIPAGYDVPIDVVFGNGNQTNQNWRCQLYVNGFQFGRYLQNIGPQKRFPVPEGILNYRGKNYIAIELWAQDNDGDAVGPISLESGQPVQWGYTAPGYLNAGNWAKRPGVY